MHPIHFWFIHDLRAYKKAMIALAEKSVQVHEAKQSPDATIRGYRPTSDQDTTYNEFYSLAETYLKAYGHVWHHDLPSKLYFLQRDRIITRLTARKLDRTKKLPDFSIRLPPAFKKTCSELNDPFWVLFYICFSPLLLAVAAIVFALKAVEHCGHLLLKLGNWGLKKALPENLPESRVLGTEKSPRKLPAQIT